MILVPDGTTAFLDPATGKPARSVRSEFGFGNTSAFSADGMVSLRESFVKLIGCSAMST